MSQGENQNGNHQNCLVDDDGVSKIAWLPLCFTFNIFSNTKPIIVDSFHQIIILKKIPVSIFFFISNMARFLYKMACQRKKIVIDNVFFYLFIYMCVHVYMCVIVHKPVSIKKKFVFSHHIGTNSWARVSPKIVHWWLGLSHNRWNTKILFWEMGKSCGCCCHERSQNKTFTWFWIHYVLKVIHGGWRSETTTTQNWWKVNKQKIRDFSW